MKELTKAEAEALANALHCAFPGMCKMVRSTPRDGGEWYVVASTPVSSLQYCYPVPTQDASFADDAATGLFLRAFVRIFGAEAAREFLDSLDDDEIDEPTGALARALIAHGENSTTCPFEIGVVCACLVGETCPHSDGGAA